jgi:glycerophosphoryl diester phosphodiesterase
MNFEELKPFLRLKPFPKVDWQWPQLQSHRGFCLEGARENTLESLAQAKAKNYLMAEVDVRLSKDMVPVLSHDKNLSRLVGKNLKFSALTAKQLEAWDFPTLQEVLRTKNRPDLINIEIKNDDRWDTLLEKKVIQAIRETKKSKCVLVSAFNPISLKVFTEQIPELPRGLLIALDKVHRLSYWRLIGNLVAQAHMINWPYQLLNESLVSFLKDSKVPIATWTVNDYRQASKLLDWGVDTVITDRVLPDQLESFFSA